MADMSSSRDDRFVRRLDFASGTLCADWKAFKSQFDIYKIAKKYSDMGEDEQIANLLVLMGPESVPIFTQFLFDNDDENKKKTLANVMRMFDEHFEPVKNILYERFKFNGMKQGDLSIHQFITELQSQADNCDYGQMKDQLIRDRIIIGVNDSKLREYLIDLDDLSLARCIQKAKQHVSQHESTAMISGRNDGNIDNVAESKGESVNTVRSSRKFVPREKKKTLDTKDRCIYCNRNMHARERCPAKRSTCYACGEKGHWAKTKACKGKKQEATNDEVVSDEMDGLFLGDSD